MRLKFGLEAGEALVLERPFQLKSERKTWRCDAGGSKTTHNPSCQQKPGWLLLCTLINHLVGIENRKRLN